MLCAIGRFFVRAFADEVIRLKESQRMYGVTAYRLADIAGVACRWFCVIRLNFLRTVLDPVLTSPVSGYTPSTAHGTHARDLANIAHIVLRRWRML